MSSGVVVGTTSRSSTYSCAANRLMTGAPKKAGSPDSSAVLPVAARRPRWPRCPGSPNLAQFTARRLTPRFANQGLTRAKDGHFEFQGTQLDGPRRVSRCLRPLTPTPLTCSWNWLAIGPTHPGRPEPRLLLPTEGPATWGCSFGMPCGVLCTGRVLSPTHTSRIAKDIGSFRGTAGSRRGNAGGFGSQRSLPRHAAYGCAGN